MIKARKYYKARLGIVFIFFVFIFFTVFIRLFLLQIYQKDFFRLLALQQYNFSVKINLPRGDIYDRTGHVSLAFNHDVPSAFILPHQFNEQKKTEEFLRMYYPDVCKKIKSRPDKYFFWLDRCLTQVQVDKLKKIGTSDIQFIDEPRRFYCSPASAHLIGFTDIDNKGISGIELELDSWLGGRSMCVRIEKDARVKDFYFGKLVEEEGCSGKPVYLTVDGNLQTLAYEELKATIKEYQAESGSVLVLDPDSGEILVMTNYPSFDLNEKSIQKFDVTKNFIVTECFEFGSVMKIFLALAGLAEEVVKPDEIFDCEGKVTFVNGFKVENWKTLGILNFSDVIKFSSNVGVAKVATRLNQKFYEHLKKLGFGVKTGVEFPGERDGFVNPPENWSRSSPLVMSFGYEIMTSLLQLGRAFCVFINGGYLIKPTLILEPKSKMQADKVRLYDFKVIEQMREILKNCADNYRVKGCTVMGKTGTARCVVDGVYSKKEHIYTFVGGIEKGNYKRVIVAFVNRPQRSHLWASQVVAPLFQRVAERVVISESIDGKKVMV